MLKIVSRSQLDSSQRREVLQQLFCLPEILVGFSERMFIVPSAVAGKMEQCETKAFARCGSKILSQIVRTIFVVLEQQSRTEDESKI